MFLNKTSGVTLNVLVFIFAAGVLRMFASFYENGGRSAAGIRQQQQVGALRFFGRALWEQEVKVTPGFSHHRVTGIPAEFVVNFFFFVLHFSARLKSFGAKYI